MRPQAASSEASFQSQLIGTDSVTRTQKEAVTWKKKHLQESGNSAVAVLHIFSKNDTYVGKIKIYYFISLVNLDFAIFFFFDIVKYNEGKDAYTLC